MRRAAKVALVVVMLFWLSAIRLEQEEPGDQYPVAGIFLPAAAALGVYLVATRRRRQ